MLLLYVVAKAMGKGNKHGGGRGKQFSAPEDIEAESRGRVAKQNSKAGMMPSSEEEESEEEEVQRGGQNPNAGMMPPSDDDEDEDSAPEVDAGAAEKAQLRKILGNAGVPESAMKELTLQLMKWKAGAEVKLAPKSAARAPEPTRKEREAMAASKKEEESSSDEEPDPEVAKRLEAVRKRREAQAKQRIANDGYDRMKPLSADNHPPGSVWPPPGQPADVS